MPDYQHVKVPAGGRKITVNPDSSLTVPDNPIVPYIEGDGTGVDITMVAPDFVASEIHKRSEGADGKPLGESPMQESRIMTAEECAAMIVRGMQGRKRLVIGSLRGKLGRVVRIFAPGLIDRVAKRAIERGR